MKALLIGLPNVGKSTIFRRLVTRKARIATYPGSAVEVARGAAELGRARHPSCPSKLPAALASTVHGLVALMAAKAVPERGQRALPLFSLVDDNATSRWAPQRSEVHDSTAAHTVIEDARRALSLPLDAIISRTNDLRADAWYAETVHLKRVTSTPYGRGRSALIFDCSVSILEAAVPSPFPAGDGGFSPSSIHTCTRG